MRPFALFTTLVIAACVFVQGAPVSEVGLQTTDGAFELEAASHQFDARTTKAKVAKKPASAAAAASAPKGAGAKPVGKTTADSSTKSAKKTSSTPAKKCAALQGCAGCTANSACGFSKTTFKCESKKHTGQITAENKQGCALMNQMQGLFQAVNGKSAAGVIPAAVASEFNHISGHVLKGEASNPDAGRHTKSAWLATHKNQTPTTQNAKTHILQFPPLKTVWDDGFYDDTDIKNMCAVSIALRKKAGSARASFVVQTPFGTPICVETFTQGTGSCFPVGTDKPKQGLGQQCGQGQD